MKKTFYSAVVLLLVGFQLSATVFTIINVAQSTRGSSLGVDPYWTGNPRGFWYLPFDEKEGKKTYNTWHHVLRAIYVQYPDGKCFNFNLEKMNLSRVSTNIYIYINDRGKGYIKKGGELFKIEGKEYSCRGVHIFE